MNAIFEERLIGPSNYVGPPPYTATPDTFTSPPIPRASLNAAVKSEQEVDLTPITSPRGNNFQLYLREIGQVKLLAPEEEIALAARIQAGDTDALEQMIKANLRLVVKIARDYEGLGLPLLDLVSEGEFTPRSWLEVPVKVPVKR